MYCSCGFRSPVSKPCFWAALFVGLLLLIAALTFAVSPMNGEDYALTRQFTGEGIVDRLVWVEERSWRQIVNWNARLGEQLSIFWLSMPAFWFTAANTLAISTFAVVLALFATREENWNSQELLISSFWVLVTSYLFWPRLEVFFWKTTAAGYLQPLVMTLFLVLPFYSSRACRALFSKKYVIGIFLILGVLAGFSFENVPPAILPFMAIMVVASFRRCSEYRVSLSLVLAAYLLGWLALMGMPSTRARTAWYMNAYAIPDSSPAYYFERAMTVVDAFVGSSAALLSLLAALIVFSFLKNRGFLLWRKPLILLLIPAGLCVASLVKAPYIEPRGFSLAWCVLCLLSVSLINDICRALSERARLFVVLVGGVVSLALAAHVFQVYLDYSRKVSLRTDQVVAAQNSDMCRKGLGFYLVSSSMDARIINNREDWVQNNLHQVGGYFNCNLRLSGEVK